MTGLALTGGTWLALWLVQATLVSALAWLALRIGHGWSPRARHALVSVAFLSFACPPILNVRTLPSAGTAVGSLVAAGLEPGASAWTLSGAPFAGIALLWAAGAAILLGTIGLQAVYLARVRRQASPGGSPAIRRCLTRAAGRMMLERPPVVLVSDRAVGPCLSGLVRPAILLNGSLAGRLSPEALTLILAHEMAHLRQRDLWLNAVRAILSALWWFHPLPWILARESRRIREEMCDDAILEAFETPGSEYARTILEAAAISPGATLSRVSVGALEGGARALGRRLGRMVDPDAKRTAHLSRLQVAGAAMLAVAALNGPAVDVRTTRSGDTRVSFVHPGGHPHDHAGHHGPNHPGPGRH